MKYNTDREVSKLFDKSFGNFPQSRAVKRFIAQIRASDRKELLTLKLLQNHACRGIKTAK